ncbi:hypothetical protein CBL_03580 [Carabus blaptoides fortunei]
MVGSYRPLQTRTCTATVLFEHTIPARPPTAIINMNYCCASPLRKMDHRHTKHSCKSPTLGTRRSSDIVLFPGQCYNGAARSSLWISLTCAQYPEPVFCCHIIVSLLPARLHSPVLIFSIYCACAMLWLRRPMLVAYVTWVDKLTTRLRWDSWPHCVPASHLGDKLLYLSSFQRCWDVSGMGLVDILCMTGTRYNSPVTSPVVHITTAFAPVYEACEWLFDEIIMNEATPCCRFQRMRDSFTPECCQALRRLNGLSQFPSETLTMFAQQNELKNRRFISFAWMFMMRNLGVSSSRIHHMRLREFIPGVGTVQWLVGWLRGHVPLLISGYHSRLHIFLPYHI